MNDKKLFFHKQFSDKGAIIHCKACRGVLLIVRDIQSHTMHGNIFFDMRCPHCQTTWKAKLRMNHPPSIELEQL